MGSCGRLDEIYNRNYTGFWIIVFLDIIFVLIGYILLGIDILS